MIIYGIICVLICLQTLLFEWTELKHLRFNRRQILKANEISLNRAHCYYNVEKKAGPICLESFEYNYTAPYIVHHKPLSFSRNNEVSRGVESYTHIL